MSKTSRTLVAIGLFSMIVAIGVGIAVLLVNAKAEPKKADNTPRAMPVEVLLAVQGTKPIHVVANGVVISAREIVVQPEVTGRVVWKNPDFIPGGRLDQGTPLIRIDPRDYSTAVEQQLAQFEIRRLAFEQERSRRLIAQREWELFGDAGAPDADDPGRSLALREPHIRSAEASLRAAQTALDQSRIALSRTSIATPFNAVVQHVNVDIGQVVSPNAQLAKLVGTDSFWVQVSVPIESLPGVHIPGINAEQGSNVTIVQQIGGNSVEREGMVLRLFGDLDPVGRMARILVEVSDPMRLNGDLTTTEPGEGTPKPSHSLPLLLGAYVRVHIDAGELQNVVEIPRSTLHEGDLVYVADSENKLRIKRPTVVWRKPESLLVKGDVKGGDRIIVSQIATPLEGMKLRIISNAPSASAQGTSP